MKTYLLIILLITTTVLFQGISLSQTSETHLDYYGSHPKVWKDENGNNIFNSIEPDSITFTAETMGYDFGNSVSTAGDVNGDGYFDVIIGARGYYNNTGRVYIFFGGESMNNIADLTLTGAEWFNSFGHSLSAGDVNGDGYSDIIIGAPGAGKAYIFFGGESMNSIADIIMTREETFNFGRAVSTAGDVNGDGFCDVIVGSQDYNNNTGRAFIFFGGTSMNNIADVIMTGEGINSFFGTSVSTAGDVNGDSLADVIVGAHEDTDTGKAFIFFGGVNMNNVADVTMTGDSTLHYFGGSVSGAGDVNGDGYSDVIVGAWGYSSSTGRTYIFYGGAEMNNVADVTMTGEAANNYFGFSVSEAGDVNGDGYFDVIVGGMGYGNSTGRAYIFYGGSLMNNIADFILTGEAVNNLFGLSVSGAGDVNGDGYPDIIIGAPYYSSGRGRAYLYINFKPKPELIDPINHSINNPLTINFKWEKFNSAIYYILIVSSDSKFNNIIVNDTILIDTSKIVSGLQKDTKYFWRVRAKDTSGITYNSAIWNFTTIPPIYLNLKILIEGMYYPLFNQMARKDTVTVIIRDATSPYTIRDSAKRVIDSISFSGLFTFPNIPNGTYSLVVKHFNSIETWSKSGGENFVANDSIYNYDYTSSSSQAYGNNMKRKGSKYCIYSGDINQDGIIDGTDLLALDNDAYIFHTGLRLSTDLNGDNIVDGSDYSIGDNNGFNYVRVVSP